MNITLSIHWHFDGRNGYRYHLLEPIIDSIGIINLTAWVCRLTVPGFLVLMMTSSNGNIFCVTGPLWGESTGNCWIPLTKVSDAELCCFLCAWTNGWTNHGGAGNLRRHYDVTVLLLLFCAFALFAEMGWSEEIRRSCYTLEQRFLSTKLSS